jgi:glycyl-tRNA synthetase beta chain
MDFKHLVLEIGTEEMPYWAVYDGINYLNQKLAAVFEENRLGYQNLKVYGGPRRLVALAEVVDKTSAQLAKIKGPAYKAAYDASGNPTQAAIGFARAQGVRVEDLKVEEINGGKYVVAEKELKGRPAKELLQEVLPQIISQFSFKKSMRWGSGTFRFIRPIRWILSLLDDEVIEFEIAGISSGRQTRGHRLYATGPLTIKIAAEYPDIIENIGRVMIDHERRRQEIISGAKKAVSEFNAEPIINEETLEEVVQLVEWPEIVVGKFPEEFLVLPQEVLITVMQHHQRYFPVRERSGKLSNLFVVVHNGKPENAEIIREGNERVVLARLEDARFFYNEDLKKPLASKVEGLKGVVFQQKLGTLYEKTLRNQKLSVEVGKRLGLSESEIERIIRAAYLCKADLLTEMVNEFDELQGIMGMYYALQSGEDERVARAIYEHYLPRFYGDDLPETSEGKALSIADKLDTVCGYFLAGLEPTGSEDPYSLRRQAQGVCLIVLESGVDFDLKEAIAYSLSLYRKLPGLLDESEAFDRLLKFFEARYQRLLMERGYSQAVVQAVVSQMLERPATALKKAEVIASHLESDLIEDILTAFQRVKNLSKPELGTEYDRVYLEEKEEVELERALNEALDAFHRVDYKEQLEILAKLRKPIDAFFDSVLVMHEDLKVRENRLRLLNRILSLYLSFADFSALR